MESVFIRGVSAEELAPIVQLETEVFAFPRSMKQMRTETEDGMHETLAAFDAEGKLHGYVSLMHVLDEGYLTYIAVLNRSRRRGIAQRLLEALHERAVGLGLSFISLEVRESNLAAITLYEKNGYVRNGLMKNYYSEPKENALILTKSFNK